MNREEAILREFNLHPLWKLREGGGAATASLAAPAAQATAAAETIVAAPAAPAPEPVSAQAGAERPEVAAPALASIPPPAINSREQAIAGLDWPQLKAMVRDCAACKLRGGCTQTVFGVGDESADWLFVGEGPGADEDARGEPFVGQAGKLLDNMLLALRLKRGNNVYIANVVKCRPPNNRTPEPDEVATCLPYLQRQVALIKPKIVVALGRTAASALLQTDAALGSLRGRVHTYQPAPAGAAIPLVVTYHPAYLLRTPHDKAKAWQDLRLAAQTING